jgi:hypothetical protein
VTSFMQKARSGPVYWATDNAPMSDTARYNLFPVAAIFGSSGTMGRAPVKSDIADVLARAAESYSAGMEPIYVLVTPSMITYNEAYGFTPNSSFTILLASLARSRAWKLVVRRDGTVIYELPPTRASHGPWVPGPIANFQVP